MIHVNSQYLSCRDTCTCIYSHILEIFLHYPVLTFSLEASQFTSMLIIRIYEF